MYIIYTSGLNVIGVLGEAIACLEEKLLGSKTTLTYLTVNHTC